MVKEALDYQRRKTRENGFKVNLSDRERRELMWLAKRDGVTMSVVLRRLISMAFHHTLTMGEGEKR
jgi:hypothetical protein